jgi:hypothetical protein
MKKIITLAAASAFAVAVATPASAAITIRAGAGFVQPPENVLATTSMSGTTVMGTTNQTGTSVSITSNETISTSGSNGQASFVPADGALDIGTILLTNGGTFTSAEFNLFNASANTSSVTVTVNGVTRDFTIGNGENFIGIEATGGDVISSISFNTNGSGVADLRQVRLGGVAAAAVPEPGTWALMLLGFGAVGVSMRRRRRTTHLPQFG